jgi:transposase
LLSAGSAHDAAYFHPLLEEVRIPLRRGRPRNRPEEVVADKAYDATYIRQGLTKRGIKNMIPQKQLRKGTKRRKKGPHPRFNKQTYKERASVKQSIGWIKEWRRVATRYEKLAVSYLAFVKLAFIRFYLTKYSSDTA